MGLDSSSLLLAGAVVLAGSVLQGSTGLGLAQVAVPLLALIDTRLVPVPIAVVGLGLLVLMSVRERHALHLRGVGWSIAGYLPAAAAGAAVLPVVTGNGLAVLCGLVILIGVGISFAGWKPQATPSLLATAGFASGFMGTTTGAAGPPMALAYQRSEGPELRASLSAFFVLGNVATLTALGLAGQIHLSQLQTSALLLLFMIPGFILSGPARHILDRGVIRPVVLGISATSATVLLIEAALP